MSLRSLTLALLLVLLVAGCTSWYWTRPVSEASLACFSSDHRECIEANGLPVANRPGYVVVDEQAFRRCLIARGWMRRERLIQDVPAGYYRGYEERDLEPVRITDLPEQPPSATIDVSDPRYFIQPTPAR
jgi:hypothetical protein